MPCTEPLDSTPLIEHKSFLNWARKISFSTGKAYRPSTRGEVVKIILDAEDNDERVKWYGSLWSFMEIFISGDVMIETDDLSGVVDRSLILDRLPLLDESARETLVHIKGGTKVFNVNRLLHGLPTALNGGGADEVGLGCDAGARALPTLGGSGGQSVAGVMATGSHGGDIALPPIADAVVALHLIGPGGQEWWIERSSGVTAGSEADLERQLHEIASGSPEAGAEICNDVLVRRDDDLFRAVLVSCGRMGFVYSMVVKTVDAFKLHESRREEVWETFRDDLGAEGFMDFAADRHFLQVLINPFGNDGRHDCKVAERVIVDCETPNEVPPADKNFFDWLCKQQDVSWIIAILVVAIAALVVSIVLLVEAVSIMLATAALLLGVPVTGWILAVLLYAAIAVLIAIIIALGVIVAALAALLAYMIGSGGLTPGQLVAAITNFMFTVGLKDVMRSILTGIFNSAYPLDPSVNISWKIMDTYNYDAEDFCQKVDSMEFAFDVAAATDGGGYISFIDEVFAIFDDLYDRHIAVAGVLALRYTGATEALIGMSKFTQTCHIEIPIIREFAGNEEFLERVQLASIEHGGVPHWGQLMDTYTGLDTNRLHGSDLRTWRLQLNQLIREGGGGRDTFSNNFTQTYNLEPIDETPISAVRFTITVGEDSLGDTDILRHDVSADFAIVVLNDDTVFEVSLNEGAEWPAHTTHTREVPVDPGTLWGDVRVVRIRHEAAGSDHNADNWKMNEIVITSIATDGTENVQFRHRDTPIWEFKKNERQIWEQPFP